MKGTPGVIRTSNDDEIDVQIPEEFDKEFEEFVAEQKKLRKKRKKNANDQSDQQVEADLKP